MADRPTRSQLIGSLATAAVLQARLQWQVYAAAVVRHYHDDVDLLDRDVRFHVATTADDHANASRLNTQTVRRLLCGEIRMSADIEESLINALPDPYRDRLLAALLARDGLMLAHRPPSAGDAAGQVAAPAELMRRAAEAVQAIAPMLADNNSIGPEDHPHFANALRAINASMGAHITVSSMITDAMVQVPGAVPGLRAVR